MIKQNVFIFMFVYGTVLKNFPKFPMNFPKFPVSWNIVQTWNISKIPQKKVPMETLVKMHVDFIRRCRDYKRVTPC